MDAVSPRSQFETPEADGPADGPERSGEPTRFDAQFARARQDFLDALPIAAALIQLDEAGELRTQARNEKFVPLAAPQPAGDGARKASFLEASGVSRRIAEFLRSSERVREFDASDGAPVGGRTFAVRLVRMRPFPPFGPRVAVTLVEKTAEIESQRSLRAEMLRDSLTGLANRTAFNEAVAKVLEDPAFLPGSHAVLVVDINRFSRVNECVGAIAGDELLITFARRLVSALRAHDLLARTGGDEFAVLMRLERGLDDALQAAERIRSTMAEPFRLTEIEMRVDCATGCALLSGGEDVPEEVLRNAQFALKRAKGSGHVQIYEPNQARAARRRFSVETELRQAIEAGELRLAFQPIVEFDSGAVSGFEALARWNHARRGPISPEEFIPVAEESGLIVPLGRWAMDSALATLAAWDRALGRTLPLRVNVNLSAIQIARDEVPDFTASLLERHAIAGDRLTLELTESAIVQDPRRATQVLEALKGLGVRIAMDDFGTGYTSLAYLQRLPIDVLKIDRSFVSDMLGDSDSVAIVRAILSLAGALGMQTTAEGIDTPQLADALKELGCSHGQGYLYSRPLGPDSALDYWTSRSA